MTTERRVTRAQNLSFVDRRMQRRTSIRRRRRRSLLNADGLKESEGAAFDGHRLSSQISQARRRCCQGKKTAASTDRPTDLARSRGEPRGSRGSLSVWVQCQTEPQNPFYSRLSQLPQPMSSANGMNVTGVYLKTSFDCQGLLLPSSFSPIA